MFCNITTRLLFPALSHCACLRVCVCQDLLGTDWAVRSASGPADVAAAVSSCALRASSVAHRETEKSCPRQTDERSAALCNVAERSTTAGQTVDPGLRRLSSSAQPPPQQPLKPCEAQDDFDDWDVDLADLDECDGQMGQPLHPPAPTPPAPAAIPASSAKTLRPPSCVGTQPRPPSLREFSAARQSSSSPRRDLPPRTLSTPVQSPNPRPAFLSAPSQSPTIFPAPSPISRPQQPQRPWATPGPSPQARGLFETVSPGPSSSTSVCAPTLSPHPLHTPVLTNRLVQLVSASSKLPNKRPHSESHRPRTRRFPGPAGLLPEQVGLRQHLLCEFFFSVWISLLAPEQSNQCFSPQL